MGEPSAYVVACPGCGEALTGWFADHQAAKDALDKVSGTDGVLAPEAGECPYCGRRRPKSGGYRSWIEKHPLSRFERN